MFHYDLKYFQSIQFAEYKEGEFYDWHPDTYDEKEPNKMRKMEN